MDDLNDKVTGETLTASEWNQVPSEIQNVITQLGQVLSGGNLNQLGIAIAGYVANGDFYTDGGAANAYSLSVVGTKQAPPSYDNGMRVRFKPSNTNTGASTVKVAGLGVKNIKTAAGADPAAGVIINGETIQLLYNSSAGYFEIQEFGGGGQLLGTAAVKAISYNAQSIGEDITIGGTQNAFSVGPITIEDTFAVTIADGGVWLIG